MGFSTPVLIVATLATTLVLVVDCKDSTRNAAKATYYTYFYSSRYLPTRGFESNSDR